MISLGAHVLVFRVEATSFKAGLEKAAQDALASGQHLYFAISMIRATRLAGEAAAATAVAADSFDEFLPALVQTTCRLAADYLAKLAHAGQQAASGAAPAQAAGTAGAAQAGAAGSSAPASGSATSPDEQPLRLLPLYINLLRPRLFALTHELHRDLVNAFVSLLDARIEVRWFVDQGGARDCREEGCGGLPRLDPARAPALHLLPPPLPPCSGPRPPWTDHD